jgi:hypothetical protein
VKSLWTWKKSEMGNQVPEDFRVNNSPVNDCKPANGNKYLLITDGYGAFVVERIRKGYSSMPGCPIPIP